LKVVEHQKDEDIRDLYLLGQAAEQVSALRPTAFYVRAASPSPLRPNGPATVKVEVTDPGFASVLDASAMPPPPPPQHTPRPSSTSPMANVSSSTSEDGCTATLQEKIQIGKVDFD